MKISYSPAVTFVLVTFLFLGCETESQKHEKNLARWRKNNPDPGPRTKQVQIISEPPGARIEVNGDYIGNAPITATIHCLRDRFTERTRIQAIPSQPGQYVQAKTFEAGTFTALGDQVPSRILFNMSLAAPPPELNVNVHQE